MATLISPPGTGGGKALLAELRGTGRFWGEYTSCRKDGSTFPAYLRVRVRVDEHGNLRSDRVAVDISDRVESERALRAASDYLRAVTDSVGEGLFTLDTGGRVTYMNELPRSLGGRARSCRTCHARLHAQPSRRWLRADDRGLPDHARPPRRQDAARRDDVFIRRDAHLMPVAYTAAPFQTETCARCVVVFEEISERKANEENLLREAEKLRVDRRIQDALAHDRFVLYAQPIIDLHSGEVVQRELLLRMREPSGEIVGPARSCRSPRTPPDRRDRPLGHRARSGDRRDGRPSSSTSRPARSRPGVPITSNAARAQRRRSDAAGVRDHRNRADRRRGGRAGLRRAPARPGSKLALDDSAPLRRFTYLKHSRSTTSRSTSSSFATSRPTRPAPTSFRPSSRSHAASS